MEKLYSLPAAVFGVLAVMVPAIYIRLLKSIIGMEAILENFLLLVVLPLVPLCSIAMLLYWRGIDEGAKEAQKFGYFWGTQLGMIAVIIAWFCFDLQSFSSGVLDGFLTTTGSETAFVHGMFTLGAFQTIGFLVLWFFWWFRRR